MNLEERYDRLDRLISEDRLIRNAWFKTDKQGRELACLLVALSPESEEDPDQCPVEVMPQWLAHLTPCLDDNGSEEAWPSVIRRYASLARRWSVLSHEQWESIRRQWLVSVIDEALSHVTKDRWGVRDACRGVQKALVAGKALANSAYYADASAAATTDSSSAAAYAAYLAATTAFSADAAYSAAAAAAAVEAADPAPSASGAWDRMTNSLFDLIEGEIATHE